MPRSALREIGRLVTSAPRVLLATHEHPDADALGSTLALAATLRSHGQEVELGCSDPVPERYRFLPGWEQFRTSASPAPVAVVLDAADAERLGGLRAAVLESAEVLVLDHHATADGWPGLLCVDPAAAAVAVLVYDLLREAALPLTPPVASCLYVGLLGDTGGFAFQNTNPEAFRVAAALVEAGAEPYQLHRSTLAQFPLAALHLRGHALAHARSAAQGRLVYSVLRLEDYAASGTTSEDTEGVIDLVRQARGAELCLLLKQEAERRWRVSLRAERHNVGEVAQAFGGGGHRLAAGCHLEGEEPEVLARILKRLEALLEVVDDE